MGMRTHAHTLCTQVRVQCTSSSSDSKHTTTVVWIAAAADTWFLRYKPVMYTSLWSSACHALQQCKPPLCTVKDVCILSVIRNEEISLYMRASTSDNVYLRCTRAFPHQESGIACMVVQDHREQKREKDRDQ